jgi:RNA polymerase sigma-70 factor (TIGR02943 family)
MGESADIIKQLVAEHTDAMYQWAMYKLNDDEQAKDIVQDTFIAAFEKVGAFEGNSTHKTWLFSILNNKIADHFRKECRNPVQWGYNDVFFKADGHWREERKPHDWGGDAHLLDNSEFVKVLNGCINGLPKGWAAAIQLKYMLGKNGTEICQELDITTTNYWQMIRRAKLNLRQCLELKWFK